MTGATTEDGSCGWPTSVLDHYHSWLESHGHSGFAWSILGAIAARTERIELATGVTCPTVRYHPAIIAQAAATTALLSDGRFVDFLASELCGPLRALAD